MLGAISGDIIGSAYEFNPIKTKDFSLFKDTSRWTDDTVCTAAVADAVLRGRPFGPTLVEWVLSRVEAGYGLDFLQWALDGGEAPYGSWGNGSAMRVSPVAWLARDLREVEALARASALPSHDHPEGVRGALATAVAVRLALEGFSKDEIRAVVTETYGYDLGRTVDAIRPGYSFKVSCQRSVPEALICFLEADSYEDALRNCVSLGGDADTQCAIAGAVAEPFFGIPDDLAEEAVRRLDDGLRATLAAFRTAVASREYGRSDPDVLTPYRPPFPDARGPSDEDARAAAVIAEFEAMDRALREGTWTPAPTTPRPGPVRRLLSALLGR